MARFDVSMHVEVEAADSEAAFADVRSNYCVVNDPDAKITHDSAQFTVVDFEIGEEPVKLEDYSAA